MEDLELGGKGFHLDHGGRIPLSGTREWFLFEAYAQGKVSDRRAESFSPPAGRRPCGNQPPVLYINIRTGAREVAPPLLAGEAA
jgi:hypothetical protein